MVNRGRLITSLTHRYDALTFLKLLSFDHRSFPDSIFVLDYALYHYADVINNYAILTGITLSFCHHIRRI